jgi:acetate kinase
MIVLVVNCGSSSIKYQLFRMPEREVLAKGLVDRVGQEGSLLKHEAGGEKHVREQPVADHKAGMQLITNALTDAEIGVIGSLDEIGAVGHRVVHGGETYSGSVLIDEDVIHCIEDYADLAPLHNPPNLTGIREAQAVLPKAPMVAVFDTAFHQTLPKHAYLYALPYAFYEKYRIRRYGFHGTSHAYVTRRAAELLGKPESEVNLITVHLGNGCSMAAVKNGRSVDTSMGLTPLEGLVMGTRSGDIDPAIFFYLLSRPEYGSYQEVDRVLNKESGLLGISGISNDMRTLEEKEEEGEDRATLAIDIFAYRLRKYVGAYMAVLGRTDAICFMGGIGENGPIERIRALEGLEGLGIELDPEKNDATIRGKGGDIATPASRVRVLVVPTDEEGWIARETYEIAGQA